LFYVVALETFEQWNGQLEIAKAARQLYGHIDNLELYVGLVCEETMEPSQGLMFACGYTVRLTGFALF
jgi:linoleate 10R-lipoxygenase